MSTRFRGHHAEHLLAVQRFRLAGAGGCLSGGLALACTPIDGFAGRRAEPVFDSSRRKESDQAEISFSAVDAPPAPDQPAIPTSIVGSVPADGALGVLPDVVLVIDFGRAMDVTSVPRAIASDDIRIRWGGVHLEC